MEKIKELALDFAALGIKAYYVGGWVRDQLMGNTSDDIDICLVGVKDKAIVEEVVSNYGTITREVGNNFPNWIADIDGNKVDFALARAEKLVGFTRKDFNMTTDNVSIVEDLLRRDFTINAIAIDILSGDVIDPYGGREHIKAKVVHPVSDAFKEDRLRVYRGARFCARFDFAPSFRFLEVSTSLIPNDVSNERVGTELYKLFNQATKPSIFFNILRSIRWLGYHFGELEDTINIPQDPTHHPEGDVFVHTLHCMDAANDWFTRACMLCHDLGKVDTTTFTPEGKIKSIGHEEASVPLTHKLLERVHFCDGKTRRQIAKLVELHMLRTRIHKGNEEKIVRQTLRELIPLNLSYSQLADVIHADLNGRPPKEGPSITQLYDELHVDLSHELINDMAPIVTGKILLEEGIKPGPRMGEITKKALELQDRGTLRRENWKERLRGAGFKEIKLVKING